MHSCYRENKEKLVDVTLRAMLPRVRLNLKKKLSEITLKSEPNHFKV